MSDGVYVRVTYRDEICFEKKFRVISGDTIVLSVDDLVAEKVAVLHDKRANDTKTVAPREVEIEFKEWIHPNMGLVPVDPKTPLILKAVIREEV